MRNVNSAKLRQLATELRQETPLTEPAAKTALAVAASAVNVLADIHELLSDTEYDSETPDQIANLLREHGLPVFGRDEACDEDDLKAKYGEEGHPTATKERWRYAVTDKGCLIGYWKWVELQVSAGD